MLSYRISTREQDQMLQKKTGMKLPAAGGWVARYFLCVDHTDRTGGTQGKANFPPINLPISVYDEDGPVSPGYVMRMS